MIRTLARTGLVALVAVAVLAAWKQPTAQVLCTMSRAVMPASCCQDIAEAPAANSVFTAPACCCELVDPILPAAALPAIPTTQSADGSSPGPVLLPARLSRRDGTDSCTQRRVIAARYREVGAQERRPWYERYCSYLL
jgi:hypothetical protein